MRTGAAFAAVLLAFVPLRAAGPDTILLRGATIHPVSGPDITDGSVLLRDGKIAEVGTRIAAPKGARVIELKGLHIYPGMIDSGTEIGLTEIEAVREMSDVSDIGLFKPQLRAATAVNPASEHIPVTRANGITSVITSPGGGIIAGQSVWMHLGRHGGARARRHAIGVSKHPDAESLLRIRGARPGIGVHRRKEKIRAAVTRVEWLHGVGAALPAS